MRDFEILFEAFQSYVFFSHNRNRVVTISGPHQAVATAKYLIEKRIQEEDENRLASTSNSSY